MEHTSNIMSENVGTLKQMNVCRVCLASDRRMISATRYEDMYRDLTGIIIISPSDRLPQWLCYECSALLEKYNILRKKMIKSYYTLYQYVTEGVPFTCVDKKSSHLAQTSFTHFEKPSIEAEQEMIKDNHISPSIKLETADGKFENYYDDNITIKDTSNIMSKNVGTLKQMSVCRGCLASDRRMISAKRYEDMYRDLTGLIISPSDRLPQWLCYECSALLKKYNILRNKMIKSYYTLYQYVTEGVPFACVENKSSHLAQTSITHNEKTSIEAEQEMIKDNHISPSIEHEMAEVKFENYHDDNMKIEEWRFEDHLNKLTSDSSILELKHEKQTEQGEASPHESHVESEAARPSLRARLLFEEHHMSQPNKIIAAVPVVRTPGGSVEVPDQGVNILLEASPGQLRAWRPSSTPTVASPKRVGSPCCPGRLPKRSRRSLLEDIENLINCPNSGSEIDENSDDDEDLIIMGDVASSMRLVARKLREFNVYREEGQSDAMQVFLEKEGLGMTELLADVDGISDGAVGTAAGGIVAASGGEPSGGEQEPQQGGDSGADGSGAATEADGAAVGDVTAGPGDLNRFSWSEDFSTFSGHQEVYLNTPGPQVQSDQPADLFTQVWDLPIIRHIVEQTNKYAWQTIAKLSEDGRLTKDLDTWEETTVEEIYRLFALLNYMSLCYRSQIDEYWITGTLGMPEFRSIMSKNRFKMLIRFLHFVDNDTIEFRPHNKKIAKIEPIITHCNNKFSSMYTPQQTLSLDESLLLWKGRLSLVQCIRSKAARFGLKSLELSEASSGYLLRSLLYTGKHCTMSQGAIHGFEDPTAKVVLKLMDGYLDIGHTLVMDNWYNQLPLTRYLKHRHTDVIGTMDRRRAHVPLAIKCANDSRMQRGQQLAQHCGDITIVAWKDVKLVTAISTFHNAEQVRCRRAGEVFDKPKLIEYYNKNMGGVDLKDQKLSAYHFERKKVKTWYMKVFRRLLNTSLLNTFIIYSKNPLENMLSHRQFRYKVSEGLLAKYKKTVVLPCITGPQEASCVRLDPNKKHFPVHTELSGRVKGNDKYMRRRCARCSAMGVRSQVRQMCSACNVGLCIGPCWMEYHTLEKL